MAAINIGGHKQKHLGPGGVTHTKKHERSQRDENQSNTITLTVVRLTPEEQKKASAALTLCLCHFSGLFQTIEMLTVLAKCIEIEQDMIKAGASFLAANKDLRPKAQEWLGRPSVSLIFMLGPPLLSVLLEQGGAKV